MRLTIRANGLNCPADRPVSLVDLDTDQLIARHLSIGDAVRHRRLLESELRDDDETCSDDEMCDDDESDDEGDDLYCPLCGEGHDEEDHTDPDDGDDDDSDSDSDFDEAEEDCDDAYASRNAPAWVS